MPERILRPAELIDLSNQPVYGSIAYKPFKPEEEIRKKVEGKKTFMHLGLYTKKSEQTLTFVFSLFFLLIISFLFFSFLSSYPLLFLLFILYSSFTLSCCPLHCV